jgi:hypothetical protein
MFRYFIYISAVVSMAVGVLASGALPLFGAFRSGGDTLIASHLIFDLQIAAPDSGESVTGDPGGEDDDFADFATKTWQWSKIAPGAGGDCAVASTDCTGGDSVTGEVRLRQNPEAPYSPNHLEIRATLMITNSGVESNTQGDATAAEMAKKLVIFTMAYDGDDCLSDAEIGGCLLADHDGDGELTLNDLSADNALDNLSPPPEDPDYAVFSMELKWAEDPAMGPDFNYIKYCGATGLNAAPRLCDNAFQGDSLALTVVFTLNESALD